MTKQIKTEEYIKSDKPGDIFRYRIDILKGDYAGVLVEYWDAMIVSSQYQGKTEHKMNFNFDILKTPLIDLKAKQSIDPTILKDSIRFKTHISDILVDVIHRECGTLKHPLEARA